MMTRPPEYLKDIISKNKREHNKRAVEIAPAYSKGEGSIQRLP